MPSIKSIAVIGLGYVGLPIALLASKKGFKIIGSPEEVAYREGFITRDQLSELAQPLKKSGYGEYLLEMVKE